LRAYVPPLPRPGMDDSIMAQVFALSNDEVQAEFLNTIDCTARRTWKDYDLQLCRIADKLNHDGREMVKRLADFVISDEGGKRG